MTSRLPFFIKKFFENLPTGKLYRVRSSTNFFINNNFPDDRWVDKTEPLLLLEVTNIRILADDFLMFPIFKDLIDGV